MPPHRKIPQAVQSHVRRRANGLCEYCHAAEQWQYVPFTMDHIIPLAQGGTSTPDNLALACFHCNRRKSALTRVTDPDSGEDVSLFHPRRDVWSTHFIWSPDSVRLVGLTPTGRATIAALNLNRERAVNIRSADWAADRHPPAGDPIQNKGNESM